MSHIHLSDPNPFSYYEKQVKDIKDWRRRYNPWYDVYSVKRWDSGWLEHLCGGIFFLTYDLGDSKGGYVVKSGFTHKIHWSQSRGWRSLCSTKSLDIVALREEPEAEGAEGKLHVKVRLI